MPRIDSSRSGTDVIQSAMSPLGGKAFVPPAYMQTTGDAVLQLNSASIKGAFRFPTPADYTLRAISTYVTAVAVAGNINLELYTVNESGAYEPNGFLNGNSTNSAPTMTANNLPAPNIAALKDSAGANAEAGAGMEAFEALDGVTSADNGTRSNAAPTGVAPIILTLDLGTGNGLRLNKYRFYSWNNADANVRAFPKAWTVWGSNLESPAAETDGDWVQLLGANGAAWTAETDPGAGLGREYWLVNATSYRWLRFKFTDRNGANAYMALGELQLFGASLSWSPGTLIYDIGSVSSGAAADTWVIKTLSAAQQLDRNKSYCIVWTGTAAKDYSLSLRRSNTANGCGFPDGCCAKQSSDVGVTWTECQQDYKSALINCVINPTSHGTPQLHIGRGGKDASAYVYLPGNGLVAIPQAGIQVDCEGLTASVDHTNWTWYDIYVYLSGGTLIAEASTTGPTTSEGIMVKTGATTHRYVGSMCVKNLLSTYQGPIDVPDARWLYIPNQETLLYKANPYYTLTQQAAPLALWNSWGPSHFIISCISPDYSDLEMTLMPGSQTQTTLRDTVLFINGNRVRDVTSHSNAATTSSTEILKVNTSLQRGLHTLDPNLRAQTALTNINHWRSYHADGTVGTLSMFQGRVMWK